MAAAPAIVGGRVRIEGLRPDSAQADARLGRLMADAGHDVTLEPRDAGGYALRQAGEIVLDLPPCSEGRAAWCAWFFVQPGLNHRNAPARHH